ncbi:partitioning defective 3 homolog isoform X2 [Ciona intestinalis]
MKVTVCFGNIRVIVPCGKGDLSIADLQEKACARYRKAIGKDSEYWIRVLQLSAVDGGILDWDDFVYDVIEDKDKLIAVYEEEEPQPVDWDLGSITSSEGRSSRSAMINTKYTPTNGRIIYQPHSKDTSLEVDVGLDALKSNSQIVVRRDHDVSDASMNHDSMLSSIEQSDDRGQNGSYLQQIMKNTKHPEPKQPDRRHDDERSYFVRDVTRQSMASGLSESVESDKQYYNPLHTTTYYNYPPSPNNKPNGYGEQTDKSKDSVYVESLPWFYKDSQEVCLSNDGRELGIQVSEYRDRSNNKFAGLLVSSIKSGSRVEEEKLLSHGDVIVEINQHVLMYFNFDDAKAILNESCHYAELQLRILPVEELERHGEFESRPSNVPSLSLTTASPPISSDAQPKNLSVSQSSTSASSMSTHESTSPHTKLPLIAQQSYDNVSCYTRKIGSRIDIQLMKETSGLGFSITTRDTSVGDPGPIYIRNILPTGAAVQDGRLQAGDRLLEVNGEDMNGKTQEDAVAILRGIVIGSLVNLVVSRQNETLPRKLKDDPVTDKVIREENMKEFFMFEIPLNDTGSAGLGISLKGNQSKKSGKDLGIFVKAIFHGGAAWQDGRLKVNDQLVKVNGHSMTGATNREAIDILRTSMSNEGNIRGLIQMVVARRHPTSSRVSSEASSDLSDSILDQLSTRSGSQDMVKPMHRKQASLPALFIETSFGPDDAPPVSSTLERKDKRGRPSSRGAVARRISHHHIRSKSVTAESDHVDVEVVKKVREKILNSSSSSFLSNLIQQSPASPTSPDPSRSSTPNPYATWTIPRTHRIAKRSLSLRSSRNNGGVNCGEHSRRVFESITANELTIDDTRSRMLDEDEPLDLSQTRSTSPINPDVVMVDDDWPNVSDPFNRESVTRQSMSEKRKDPIPRLPFNVEGKSNKDKDSTTPYSTKQTNNNNSRNSGSNVPQPMSFKKSVSTESLLTANTLHSNCMQGRQGKKDQVDVGPTLGIAKSSSLESLQSAVEKCYVEDKLDAGYPRALPKVVRGRLMNDSFRAALDRSYDMSSGTPHIKPMDILQEDADFDQTNEQTRKKRSTNKGTKFFGLFKLNKSKRNQGSSPRGNLAESEVYKRGLEANRVREFERMNVEKEIIQAKVHELRNRQLNSQTETKPKSEYDRLRPPSVPVTSMQRIRDNDVILNYNSTPSGRHSVDPSSMKNQSIMTSQREQSPQHPTSSRRKIKDSKFKENSSLHSSLPRFENYIGNGSIHPYRQPRRERWSNASHLPHETSPVRPFTSRGTSSMTKFDNREFYNRQKPSSTRSRPDPASAEKMRGGRSSLDQRTLYYDDRERSQPDEFTHRREKSPEPPSQSFYVSNNRTPQRRGTIDVVPTSNIHGHTTSPHQQNTRFANNDHYDITEDNSRISEASERNRATFYRLMRTQSPNGVDDRVEKIEISVPYNL